MHRIPSNYLTRHRKVHAVRLLGTSHGGAIKSLPVVVQSRRDYLYCVPGEKCIWREIGSISESGLNGNANYLLGLCHTGRQSEVKSSNVLMSLTNSYVLGACHWTVLGRKNYWLLNFRGHIMIIMIVASTVYIPVEYIIWPLFQQKWIDSYAL